MKSKPLILILIWIFFFNQCVFAAEIKKINIEEAIELALKNNIDLKVQKLDEDIARNNIKSAIRWQNPELNTFWNYGKAGTGNPHQIGFSQTVELFKRPARRKFATSNLDLTVEKINNARFELKMDIREAYVNLVAAKAILRSLEDDQKLLEELKNIAKNRTESSDTEDIDVIQSEIALNQALTQLNSARANVNAARIEFNKILNTIQNNEITYDTEDEKLDTNGAFIDLLTPPPDTVMLPFVEISDIALKSRYDLKIAKKEIDSAKNNLTIVARQRIPDLELQAGYAFQPKGVSEEGKYLSGGYAGANLVNLPLFYNYSPEIKNAKLELDKAELKYVSAKNKAVQDLSIAYEKFGAAKLNLNYYRDNLLENSREMIKISNKSYKAGKSSLTSLIVVEQAYKSILVSYTYALAQYYNCWIDFLREADTEEFNPIAESV